MKEIEEGEFFRLNTDNRMEGFQLILQQLRDKGILDKGRAVELLEKEEIYSQRQDCKDFLRNVIRSSNLEVVSVARRKIALTGTKNMVTAK